MPYAKSRIRKSHNQHEKRDNLARLVGKPDFYTATFIRYGYDVAHRERKILVSGVKNSAGQFITKHVWLPLTDEIVDQNLNFGDRFEFVGVPTKYEKGTITDGIVYEAFTITNPTNAQKIGRAQF